MGAKKCTINIQRFFGRFYESRFGLFRRQIGTLYMQGKKALYNCKWPKFKYDCLDLDTAASRGRGCRIRGTGEDSRRWDSGRNGRSDPCQRILCWSRGHLKDEAGEATLG